MLLQAIFSDLFFSCFVHQEQTFASKSDYEADNGERKLHAERQRVCDLYHYLGLHSKHLNFIG